MKTVPTLKIALVVLICMSTMSCFFTDEFSGDAPGASSKPLIIAHRGAQSVFPEHTLEGYTKAIEWGADYIEPDLVMTKDGYLVVRHEPMLSATTNVADLPEFATLKTTKSLDGKMVTDWFATDFTLAQIKTLRARQAFAGRPTNFDDQFSIPTFEEVIQLAKKKSREVGRPIGIYPEIKHPHFHTTEILGLRMEDVLLHELKKAKWNQKSAPVFVQCFEVAPLQYLRQKSSVKLVQLISCYNIASNGDLIFDVPEGEFISYGAPFDFYEKGDPRTYEFFTTPEGMDFVAGYADGIGPWKPFIISYVTATSGSITLLPPSDFITLAHQNDLQVHPYTFRNENTQWSGGIPEAEYHLFFDAGVDGVFTDYTDEAVKAVQTWTP